MIKVKELFERRCENCDIGYTELPKQWKKELREWTCTCLDLAFGQCKHAHLMKSPEVRNISKQDLESLACLEFDPDESLAMDEEFPLKAAVVAASVLYLDQSESFSLGVVCQPERVGFLCISYGKNIIPLEMLWRLPSSGRLIEDDLFGNDEFVQDCISNTLELIDKKSRLRKEIEQSGKVNLMQFKLWRQP